MNLLFSPHQDDETLFSAFGAQKHGCLVVVVFDGHVQQRRGEPVTSGQRRSETNAAMMQLGLSPALFMGYSDAQEAPASLGDNVRSLIERHKPEVVLAPGVEVDGHQQHNIVGRIVRAAFPDTTHYLTYTRSGGKSRSGTEVIPEPDWIRRKLLALACYESQIGVKNCRDHFMGDIREYLA